MQSIQNFMDWLKDDSKLYIWSIFLSILVTVGLYAWYEQIGYILSYISFPYDWAPSDGDHIALAQRISEGHPIYSNWLEGNLLNVYNPGYHYLLALLSKFTTLTPPVARWVSFIFFVLCPGVIFLTLYKYHTAQIKNHKQSKFNIVTGLLICSCFALALPLTSFQTVMALDMVFITPTTLLIFFFLLSSYFLHQWTETRKKTYLITFVLLAIFSYLSKQQGIIPMLTACVLMLLLILKGEKKINFLLFSSVSAILWAAIILSLEIKNNFNFIHSTLIYLPKVYLSSEKDSVLRIYEFCRNNFSFLCFCLMGFYFSNENKKWKNIWYISLPIHFFILRKTAGNIAGGPNYFIPLWCTLLVTSGMFFSDLFNDHQNRAWNRKSILKDLAITILLIGTIDHSKHAIHINKIAFAQNLPKEELVSMTGNYFKFVQSLPIEPGKSEVLLNRISYPFISKGAVLNNDFSAVQTAWYNNWQEFDRQFIIKKIMNKEYSYITRGAQNYPEPIEKAIKEYYSPIWEGFCNFNLGRLAHMEILVPIQNSKEAKK